jgi:hypothetical protein
MQIKSISPKWEPMKKSYYVSMSIVALLASCGKTTIPTSKAKDSLTSNAPATTLPAKDKGAEFLSLRATKDAAHIEQWKKDYEGCYAVEKIENTGIKTDGFG